MSQLTEYQFRNPRKHNSVSRCRISRLRKLATICQSRTGKQTDDLPVRIQPTRPSTSSMRKVPQELRFFKTRQEDSPGGSSTLVPSVNAH